MQRIALITILIIGTVGTVVSGLLAYQEWFAQHLSVMGASFGAAGSLFGIPGGFIFCATLLVITVVAAIGLFIKR
jgi:hypothetical protein